jgi:hypothetical protein
MQPTGGSRRRFPLQAGSYSVPQIPLLDAERGIAWTPNAAYAQSTLIERRPRRYPELGLTGSVPLYDQFARDPESLQWVSDPKRLASLWPYFEP